MYFDDLHLIFLYNKDKLEFQFYFLESPWLYPGLYSDFLNSFQQM